MPTVVIKIFWAKSKLKFPQKRSNEPLVLIFVSVQSPDRLWQSLGPEGGPSEKKLAVPYVDHTPPPEGGSSAPTHPSTLKTLGEGGVK